MSGERRILLADANEEYRLLMREMIESTGEFVLAAHTGSGREALALARQLRADVLITDAVLPDMGGFALLDALKGLVPGLAIITGHCSREILLEVIRRELYLFLPKPFREEALLALLRRACGEGVERCSPAPWEVSVSRMLHDVGVPAHMKGCPYVRRAILMVAEEPELAHALTKALYPALARQFATTPGCVERAIRSAVDAAWLRGDPETQRKYFTVDKPSNGSFIAALAERLRLQMDHTVA